MMSNLQNFAYKAMQSDGKACRGQIMAANEAEVFAKLRAENLSPVSIKVRGGASESSNLKIPGWWPKRSDLTDLELEDLLQSLAVLLRAGADIRTALGVLSSDSAPIKAVSQKILGGSSLDAALAQVIPTSLSHLRGLIAAGELRGNTAAGLDAAARVLSTRRKIRQQLFEALSYPAFVFISALGALSVILLVVVPAIAPLLTDSGQKLPLYFNIIFVLSGLLQKGWGVVLGAILMSALALFAGWRYGALRPWLDRWWLDGPFGGVARPLIYGGFAKTLGDSLEAGANMTEGLRLCQRSLGNGEARKRLDVLTTHIRQGRSLSEALRQVRGFPKAIIKLCEVGEASSALGSMVARAGEREEQAALVKIDKYSKLLGPLLIMALGAMIGLLMAGVLTALTDIGATSGN